MRLLSARILIPLAALLAPAAAQAQARSCIRVEIMMTGGDQSMLVERTRKWNEKLRHLTGSRVFLEVLSNDNPNPIEGTEQCPRALRIASMTAGLSDPSDRRRAHVSATYRYEDRIMRNQNLLVPADPDPRYRIGFTLSSNQACNSEERIAFLVSTALALAPRRNHDYWRGDGERLKRELNDRCAETPSNGPPNHAIIILRAVR